MFEKTAIYTIIMQLRHKHMIRAEIVRIWITYCMNCLHSFDFICWMLFPSNMMIVYAKKNQNYPFECHNYLKHKILGIQTIIQSIIWYAIHFRNDVCVFSTQSRIDVFYDVVVVHHLNTWNSILMCWSSTRKMLDDRCKDLFRDCSHAN